VSRASVRVEGETVAAIGPGMLVLLGVRDDDDEQVAQRLAAEPLYGAFASCREPHAGPSAWTWKSSSWAMVH
jgi:hypothetical protein